MVKYLCSTASQGCPLLTSKKVSFQYFKTWHTNFFYWIFRVFMKQENSWKIMEIDLPIFMIFPDFSRFSRNFFQKYAMRSLYHLFNPLPTSDNYWKQNWLASPSHITRFCLQYTTISHWFEQQLIIHCIFADKKSVIFTSLIKFNDAYFFLYQQINNSYRNSQHLCWFNFVNKNYISAIFFKVLFF